jgi:hypothetical protein
MRTGFIYFRFVAIAWIGAGLFGLVLPDLYSSLLGVEASVGGRVWARGFGAVSVAFGAIIWLLEPSSDQRTRRAAATGAALAFGLTGIGDIVSLVAGDSPINAWALVAFNAVMVVLALFYMLTPAQTTNGGA